MASDMELETREIRDKLEDLRVEQKDEAHSQNWLKGVALTTALMAVLAAVGALQASFHADEAILASNDSILAQGKATDTWNQFQANGLKDILRQMQASQATDPKVAADLRAEAQRRSDLAGEEFNQATDLEKERDVARLRSAQAGNAHEHFAWSVASLQVGIGLASVAALTQRKAVWWLGGAFGGVGAALLGWGFLGGQG